MPEYRDESPHIGRVTDIAPQTVEIEWLVGHYSTTWKLCTYRKAGKTIPWKELIQCKDIILFPLELTKSFRLPQKTVTQLKNAYSLLL